MFQENFQGYLTCEDCLWTSLKGMELSLEWVVFSLTASCSGILYMLVIRQLKNSRVSSQNRRLTIAFAALWVSWIICVAPLLIWEPYLIRFRERKGFIPKSCPKPQWSDPADFVLFFSSFPGLWAQKSIKFKTGVDSSLRALKHAYGFINSIMLIVLLRPFHEPIRKLFNRCKRTN